jgi:Tfp pilus assembly protein PilF
MSTGTRRAISISFVLMTLVYGTAVWAQQGRDLPSMPTALHGIVRDAATHQPLAHAMVVLDREDSGFVAQAETDVGGKFSFQAPGQMVFVLRVKIPGYEDGTKRVDLTMASSDYITLELKPTKDSSSLGLAANNTLEARDAAAPPKARKEYEIARQLFQENKPGEEGIRHLKKAIQIYPDYASAYVLLAMANIGENKTDEAQTNLDKAIQLDPKFAEAYFTLGMLQNHQKKYPEAEKSLSQGLELNPNAPQGHYELAKTYWSMGKWQDAEPHAAKALELKPDLAAAHVVMGNISLRKQDPEAALKEFHEYLRLEPNGPMAGGVQQMITKIEEVMKQPQ